MLIIFSHYTEGHWFNQKLIHLIHDSTNSLMNWRHRSLQRLTTRTGVCMFSLCLGGFLLGFGGFYPQFKNMQVRRTEDTKLYMTMFEVTWITTCMTYRFKKKFGEPSIITSLVFLNISLVWISFLRWENCKNGPMSSINTLVYFITLVEDSSFLLWS